MPKFILRISEKSENDYIRDTEAECFIYSSILPDDYLEEEIKKAQSADKIILLEGEEAESKAKILSVDGIVVDLSETTSLKKEICRIRAALPHSFLGVICRNRRHEAMIVSENEPDFIIFRIWEEGKENTLELAKWYNEFFLLQMAVEPMDKQVDFTSYPADMVILNPEDYKILVAKK